MNTDDRYSIENMKKWHDSVTENAKKILREEGELQPVAFFMTEKMNIDQDIIEASFATLGGNFDDEVPLDSEKVKPGDTIIVMTNMVLGAEQALDVLKKASPEMDKIITHLQMKGRDFRAPNPDEVILDVVLKRTKMDYKDVVAMAIKNLIKKTDAIAYVKVDETWVLSMNKEELGDKTADEIAKIEVKKDLSQNPKACEAITTILEMEGYSRMLSVKFHRNRPKTGRIIGFDPPIELVKADMESVSGRFVNLFEKAKHRTEHVVAKTMN